MVAYVLVLGNVRVQEIGKDTDVNNVSKIKIKSIVVLENVARPTAALKTLELTLSPTKGTLYRLIYLGHYSLQQYAGNLTAA